jgi:AmmeMemoRadiSam system protein A
MDKICQDYLIKLARRSIDYYLENDFPLKIGSDDLPFKKVSDKRACFVTLTKKGQLRGCVGHLEPVLPLYRDVIENAVAAAFFDTRFWPLTKEELKDLEIEISILTLPKRLDYKTPNELLSKLDKTKPGVIIQKGVHRATFLPQVWEELKSPENFLSHLCLKAGLTADNWKREPLEVFVYDVESFKED